MFLHLLKKPTVNEARCDRCGLRYVDTEFDNEYYGEYDQNHDAAMPCPHCAELNQSEVKNLKNRYNLSISNDSRVIGFVFLVLVVCIIVGVAIVSHA